MEVIHAPRQIVNEEVQKSVTGTVCDSSLNYDKETIRTHAFRADLLLYSTWLRQQCDMDSWHDTAECDAKMCNRISSRKLYGWTWARYFPNIISIFLTPIKIKSRFLQVTGSAVSHFLAIGQEQFKTIWNGHLRTYIVSDLNEALSVLCQQT